MPLNIPTKSWWETELYDVEGALRFDEIAGPNQAALVKVYADGSTQSGWGLTGKKIADTDKTEPGFMERYNSDILEFAPNRALHPYNKKGDPYAYVMRSLNAVVVDIDGKNGGLQGVKQLGALPKTLAEVSKSGNGYHLWYRTNEVWDEKEGYGELPDAIGIVQGVDIRAVGCVYHYTTQR